MSRYIATFYPRKGVGKGKFCIDVLASLLHGANGKRSFWVWIRQGGFGGLGVSGMGGIGYVDVSKGLMMEKRREQGIFFELML